MTNTRKTRARLIAALTAATALFAAGCGPGAPAAGPKPKPDAEPLVLVVSEATNGTYKPSADGTRQLTLTGVDPEMTWFTDRPYRQAGHVKAQVALDALYGDDTDGPPNAALAVAAADGGPDPVIVVELTEPHYDRSGEGTLTFRATPLDEPTTGLDDYSGRTTDSFPASFGAASLFIDTLVGYNYCGAWINNDSSYTLWLDTSLGNSGGDSSWEQGNEPPAQIAPGATSAAFQAQSSWAEDCKVHVDYEYGTGGFGLVVTSPAVHDNDFAIFPYYDSQSCHAEGDLMSTSGATANVLVNFSC